MSLTERHKWCAGKILETFAPELESEILQLFIRQESNLSKFTSFFKGEGSGRLFIFYKPLEVEGEVIKDIYFIIIIRQHRYIFFSFIKLTLLL
jgi:hypothetical protein